MQTVYGYRREDRPHVHHHVYDHSARTNVSVQVHARNSGTND